MNNKLKGFTLTELLIALAIIGAIAAMAIPTVVNDINNKIHATTLKNDVAAIESVITNQFIANKTKNLLQTDFKDPEKLLTLKNFDAVRVCSASNALTDCWYTKKSGEVEGEFLDGEVKYRSINGEAMGVAAADSVLLKNGTVFSYRLADGSINGEPRIGFVDIDVNGKDGPNIWGRDFFSFHVTKFGKIVGLNDSSDYAELVTNCKAGSPSSCFSAVLQKNWKIVY